MNPFLSSLMERVGPRINAMPQQPQTPFSQFANMRPPMSGLFGGRSMQGMQAMQQRPMPMIPQINAVPRRRLNGPMQMPRLDLAQFQQAARQASPLFAPPPSPGVPPPPPPVPVPSLPPMPAMPSNGYLSPGYTLPDFANLGTQATGLGS